MLKYIILQIDDEVMRSNNVKSVSMNGFQSLSAMRQKQK